MPSPRSRTGERRATDDERPFPVPNLEQRLKCSLGIHETPEVMNVQLAESGSMGGVYRECQGGEWTISWGYASKAAQVEN